MVRSFKEYLCNLKHFGSSTFFIRSTFKGFLLKIKRSKHDNILLKYTFVKRVCGHLSLRDQTVLTLMLKVKKYTSCKSVFFRNGFNSLQRHSSPHPFSSFWPCATQPLCKQIECKCAVVLLLLFFCCCADSLFSCGQLLSRTELC